MERFSWPINHTPCDLAPEGMPKFGTSIIHIPCSFTCKPCSNHLIIGHLGKSEVGLSSSLKPFPLSLLLFSCSLSLYINSRFANHAQPNQHKLGLKTTGCSSPSTFLPFVCVFLFFFFLF